MASKNKVTLVSDLNTANVVLTTNISNTSPKIVPNVHQATDLEVRQVIRDIIDSMYTVSDGIQQTDVVGLITALASKETADPTILKQSNIVDNLITASSTAPASANTVKQLKDLIDANVFVPNQDIKLDEGGTNEVSASELRAHIDNLDLHRQISDGTVNTTSLWSSSKITTELATKSDVAHTHAQLHDQNSDTALASATANEVLASDLRSHLDSTLNPHTTTLTQTVSAAGTSLTKGTLYVGSGSSVIGLASGVDGSVLKLNSTTPSGLEWASDLGEANTITSVGTGVPVVVGKVGVDLQVRSLASLTPAITIANNSNTTEVNLLEGQINHQNLSGAGTNTHAQIDAHIAAANPHGITFDLLSPATTQGDLVVFNGAASVRLGVGTDGQVLVSNANNLQWSNDLITALTHIGTTNNPHSTTLSSVVSQEYGSISSKGTVYVSNGTTVIQVPVGIDGQVLEADSTTVSGVRWGTKGDINAGSNLAGTGSQIFSGVNASSELTFRLLETQDPTRLTVTTSGNQILFDVVESGLNHDALAGLGGTPSYTHIQIDSHINTVSGNPHNVTPADLGIAAGATANPVQLPAPALTDSTGGTIDDIVSAVSGTGDDSTINDNFAELTQQLITIRNILRNANITT